MKLQDTDMAESKKTKYLSKTVKFGDKEVTLFSLDGLTWSTRRQELSEIKDRQERDKVSFAAIKEEDGETRVVAKVPAAAKHDDSDEEDIAEVLDDEEFPIVPEVDEAPRGKRGRPGKAPVKAAAVKEIAKPANKKLSAKPTVPAKKAGKVAAKAPIAKTSKMTPKKRVVSKSAGKQSKPKAKAKKKAA